MELKRSPAIPAVSDLRPKRYPDRTSKEMLVVILRELIDEYGLEPSDIDGILTAPAAAAPGKETNMLIHEELADLLGLQPSVAGTMYAGGATYSALLHRAVAAVSSGQAESVLCLGASKFPPVRNAGEMMSQLVSHEEHEYPYGTSIPANYALTARRHMHEYGTTKEDYAQVAVSSREWALRNPDARMREEGSLSISDVLSSPTVAEPFHRLHCSVPAEGGGGILVTTGERATAIADRPAYIHGIGEHHSQGYISQARSFTDTGARRSSQEAYDMADCEPRDVDVAEIYDAFASNPLMLAEDLGLAERGKGRKLFVNGETEPGGRRPINTHGGLLSYGHPGHAAGCSVLVEGINQTMGNAGDRQVQNAKTVAIHTYGGMMNEHFTTVLEEQPA